MDWNPLVPMGCSGGAGSVLPGSGRQRWSHGGQHGGCPFHFGFAPDRRRRLGVFIRVPGG